MTGRAYKTEKLWKNKGSSWASLRGTRSKNANPMSKRSVSYRKYGLLAEKDPFTKTRKANIH